MASERNHHIEQINVSYFDEDGNWIFTMRNKFKKPVVVPRDLREAKKEILARKPEWFSHDTGKTALVEYTDHFDERVAFLVNSKGKGNKS